jgi:hypothetical protein
MGFFNDFFSWLNSSSFERDLIYYSPAIWRAIQDPGLLDRDKDILNKSFAFMWVCRGPKMKQYFIVRKIAFEADYSNDEFALCLFGKFFQRLLKAKASLMKKQMELPETNFYKYLYGTGVIIIGNCLIELGQEIRGATQETQELGYETGMGEIPPPIEVLQYQLHLRQQARYLSIHIEEHWKERELNVLCHDLESGSGGTSMRLVDEKQSNIYKLHQRIREKLKKTISEQGFSEDVGRLFICSYLKELCQNCDILTTYKEVKASKHKGGSNAEKR